MTHIITLYCAPPLPPPPPTPFLELLPGARVIIISDNLLADVFYIFQTVYTVHRPSTEFIHHPTPRAPASPERVLFRVSSFCRGAQNTVMDRRRGRTININYLLPGAQYDVHTSTYVFGCYNGRARGTAERRR